MAKLDPTKMADWEIAAAAEENMKTVYELGDELVRQALGDGGVGPRVADQAKRQHGDGSNGFGRRGDLSAEQEPSGNPDPSNRDQRDPTQDHVPPGQDEVQALDLGWGFGRRFLPPGPLLHERRGEDDRKPHNQRHQRDLPQAQAVEQHDVVISTYGLARRDVDDLRQMLEREAVLLQTAADLYPDALVLHPE